MQVVLCFNVWELTASSALPAALLHPSDKQQVSWATPKWRWHHSPHVKSCQIVALSCSESKAVQNVLLETHPIPLKVQRISNFYFHVRPQLPKIIKYVLLSLAELFHCWPVLWAIFVFTSFFIFQEKGAIACSESFFSLRWLFCRITPPASLHCKTGNSHLRPDELIQIAIHFKNWDWNNFHTSIAVSLITCIMKRVVRNTMW